MTVLTIKGAHGYNPQVPEMHPSFIFSGAGVEKRSSLEGAH
jgi:hypothetical protein